MLNAFFILTLVLFIIVCLFLILLILIQKGRGGGLSGAFGGGGGNTAFGSKTGDVLTWATSVVFGIFLILAIVLNRLANAVAAPAPTTVAPLVVGSSGATQLPDDAATLPPSTMPATIPSGALDMNAMTGAAPSPSGMTSAITPSTVPATLP